MPKLTLEQKEIIRDIRIKLQEARDESLLIPNVVFEILKEVEQEYEANK